MNKCWIVLTQTLKCGWLWILIVSSKFTSNFKNTRCYQLLFICFEISSENVDTIFYCFSFFLIAISSQWFSFPVWFVFLWTILELFGAALVAIDVYVMYFWFSIKCEFLFRCPALGWLNRLQQMELPKLMFLVWRVPTKRKNGGHPSC